MKPWIKISELKPNTRTPHWNFNLSNIWGSMMKAREKAMKSGLTVDWEIYETRTKLFQFEKRRAIRKFQRRTEGLSKVETVN